MPFPNDSQEPILEFIVGGPCVFDQGDSNKIDAAKKFITFMAQDPIYAPKIITETGLFPVSSNIDIELSTDEEKWNASAVDYFGAYYNSIPSFSTMRQAWFPTMQSILNGNNVEESLNNFVEQANDF